MRNASNRWLARYTASGTASRFGFSQPFCDSFRPALCFGFPNEYGVCYGLWLGVNGTRSRRDSAPMALASVSESIRPASVP